MKLLPKTLTIFACCLFWGKALIAQDNQKRFDAYMVVENPGSTVKSSLQNGIFYEMDPMRIRLVFNEEKWDGVTEYFVYVIKMGEEGVDIIYPHLGGGLYARAPTPFPEKTSNGKITKEIVLFDGQAGHQAGKEDYFLIMTEKPIKDYESLIRKKKNKELNVKEECLKLIKGSKLSYFYEPEYGTILIQTIQTEIRPGEEKQGLVKSFMITESDTKKKRIFAVNDSSEIFFTPAPQQDIVRDSFPTIDIIDPQLEASPQKGIRILAPNDGKKILVRGIAVDKLHGINKITVDGVPPVTYREASGYFDYLYELKDGLNTTNISVENNQGFKRTVRLVFQYTPKTEVIAHGERDYLLVIGINSYTNMQVLNNATKDARDFENLMVDEYGYKKENIIELYDADATRKNIYAQFKKFVDNLDKNDRLLVYYSGHGWYDEKLDLGFWLPVNAAINEYDDYLDNLDITRYIQKMNARNIFVIADACYSGSLLRDMQKENSHDLRSRMVLCSGKLKPVADGPPGTNSPFAEKVLRFLKTTSDKQVMASDLIQYVKKSFPPGSTQKPVGGAVDEVGDENGDFIFARKK